MANKVERENFVQTIKGHTRRGVAKQAKPA